ncbi:hypothetical protein B0H14DRAFT_768071 [Mycena olivaceomarginata]|nr:hypothetical protein B0H14DRAFT_768071 [Mycena olivaceomarginata]
MSLSVVASFTCLAVTVRCICPDGHGESAKRNVQLIFVTLGGIVRCAPLASPADQHEVRGRNCLTSTRFVELTSQPPSFLLPGFGEITRKERVPYCIPRRGIASLGSRGSNSSPRVAAQLIHRPICRQVSAESRIQFRVPWATKRA